MSAKKRPHRASRAAPRAPIVPRQTPNELAAAAGPLGEAGAELIAAVIPSLWAVPLGWKLGAVVREILGGKDTGRRLDLLRARVTGLVRTIAEVRRVALTSHGVTAEEFRDRLRDPDTQFILHAARDHYALAQLRPRLRRFAAVLADRIPRARANDAIDDDLRFARAALEVGDEGMAFLAELGQQQQLAQVHRGIGGSMLTTHSVQYYAAAHAPRSDEDVLRIVCAVDTLVAHHLVVHAGRQSGAGGVRAPSGDTLHFPDQAVRLSVWGRRFLDLVAAAGVDQPGRDAESGPDPVPAGS